MKKLLLVICLYISFCMCAKRSRRDMNEPSSKILTSFRNFETCVKNFDIHSDKIIRTEDSRAMGAKYISETDMDTQEECLRLCCVTDTCDVFVFEEKRPGSCYLFNCGSSVNFKCKFTKHHNYTSGVLTLSQHTSDAQEQDTSSKHEQELNQLRKPERESAVSSHSTPAAVPNSQTSLQESSLNLNKSLDQSHVTFGCSRFQFKCRTSGECIAIYNACDGIPQCSDASDESGCPAPVTSSLLPAVLSTRNRTEGTESLLKPYENLYHLRSQKISVPNTSESGRGQDLLQEKTVTNKHDQSPNEQLQNRRNEEHEVNRKVSANEYQRVHESFFKKPGDYSQSPEFSGFRQYSNPHDDQKSVNLDNEEHNYIAAKLMTERKNIMEHNRYEQKSQNTNLEPQIKSEFFQQQPVVDLQKNSEEIPLFETTKQESKLHPLSQIGFKQEQSDLGNAFHRQITSVHRPEVQRNEYLNEHSEKQTKLPLRDEVQISLTQHTTGLIPQVVDIEKISSHSEEHQLENRAKEQQQIPSFQDIQLHNVPDRAYKYEDDDRHIFNHKGYGLVTDSERSETPYRNANSNVQYKLSNPQRNDFIDKISSYGSQLQRNLWAEQIHPTSHVSKGAKNTPQPFDTENGYHLSSDYIHNERHHLNWNAGSLVPHSSDSAHHLSTSSVSSVQTRGPLERQSFVGEAESHREHLHNIMVPPSGSNKLVSSDSNNQDNSQDLSTKHISHINKVLGRYLIGNTPIPPTSDNEDNRKHTHVPNHHREHFVSLQQADVSEPTNAKQQERPSGALLSMSFGLCVTFIMIVLVACRLRVVKRRLRRNGKSLYAHDADYLVNGMYL